MSGQHPMNWGIDSDGEAQYPITEPWPEYSGDPPYPQDIGTDEDYLIGDYPEGSRGPAYRYAPSGTLLEAESIYVSAGSILSPPPPPLPPYNHNNLGWQATTYSPTTNSPVNTPQMVAQVVAEHPNTYYDADYSDVDPNMHYTHLMRDGRSYRQHTRYQEQSLPSALSTTDTTTSPSSSSSSPSLSSLSSSMVVNVGAVTMAEMQDQTQAEDQNMRMGNRKKKVKWEKEVATQSFATDDLRQPTASMAINTWDKVAEEI